jgi:hypothetical protein
MDSIHDLLSLIDTADSYLIITDPSIVHLGVFEIVGYQEHTAIL